MSLSLAAAALLVACAGFRLRSRRPRARLEAAGQLCVALIILSMDADRLGLPSWPATAGVAAGVVLLLAVAIARLVLEPRARPVPTGGEDPPAVYRTPQR